MKQQHNAILMHTIFASAWIMEVANILWICAALSAPAWIVAFDAFALVGISAMWVIAGRWHLK